MDRKILFRGKRTDNGEWVEGYYICLNGSQHRIYTGYAETDCGEYFAEWFDVVPETVGRYTGLTDKNSKKIFEGDIVKTKKFGKIIGYVNVNGYDIFRVVYAPAVFRLENTHREFNFVGNGTDYEVIGNIHDNPELQEG